MPEFIPLDRRPEFLRDDILDRPTLPVEAHWENPTHLDRTFRRLAQSSLTIPTPDSQSTSEFAAEIKGA